MLKGFIEVNMNRNHTHYSYICAAGYKLCMMLCYVSLATLVHGGYGRCGWFSSVPLLSRVWHFVTPWTAACQDSLSITNSWSLLKLVSIESMMPSNHLILPRECIFDFWVTWSTLSPTTQKIRFSWKSLFSFSLFGGRFRFTWILECIFL